MTATSSPAHVGTVLGDRYALVRHLARGGMGDVYEGHDALLDRPVAVKLFRAAPRSDRHRFDAEVRMLAGLNHPVLVRVYDAGSHNDDAFVVLELIDGPPLSARIRDEGPIPAATVVTLAVDLADALAYIHERGVVHRDVTPANVLCGPDGRARLVDFGIARLLESPRVTATAMTIGTASYMAPEQVRGGDVTPAADIYALGLVLLEALTARQEFTGTVHEVVAARLARDPDTDTGVPDDWRALLARMCHRDPARRPSAAEVRDRAQAISADGAAVTTAELGPITAPLAAVGPTGAVTQLIGSKTEVQPIPSFGDPDAAAPVPAPAPRAALASAVGGRTTLVLAVGVIVAALVAVAVAARGTAGDLLEDEAPPSTVAEVDLDADNDRDSTTPSTVPVTTVTTQAPIVVDTPSNLDPSSPDFDPFSVLPPGQAKKADRDDD